MVLVMRGSVVSAACGCVMLRDLREVHVMRAGVIASDG